VKYHGMSFERLNHVLLILQGRQGVSRFAGIKRGFIASSSLSNQCRGKAHDSGEHKQVGADTTLNN
jgi:hypothetical protein